MSKPQHGDPQIDQKTIILTNALKEFNVTKYLRNTDLSKLIELKSELEHLTANVGKYITIRYQQVEGGKVGASLSGRGTTRSVPLAMTTGKCSGSCKCGTHAHE